MTTTLNNYVSDSVTAGTTSFITAAAIMPDPTTIQTIWIPLITGILAPLVKELILTLRAKRKKLVEEQTENKEK